MPSTAYRLPCVLIGVLLCACPLSAQDAGVRRHALLVIEDARPTTREEAAPLLRAAAGTDVGLARQAVRALGRLEEAAFLPELRRALGDADAGVRAEAANAVAQVAGGDPSAALTALRARVDVETDAEVRGALCDALGRLPFASADVRVPVEHLLARSLAHEFSPIAVRLGAARGLDSLVRGARGTTFAVSASTIAALRAAALGTTRPERAADENRVRLAALLALNTAGAIEGVHERLAIDRDPQMRRVAVAGGLSPGASPEMRARLAARGLADAHPQVRYEALRLYARHLAATECQPVVRALDDPDAHVALQAADVLATVCPGDAATTALLRARAQFSSEGAPSTPHASGWRMPAHAVVSFARRAPADAGPLIRAAAGHNVWQVRVYAARAAAHASLADVLRTLAADSRPNVAAAAIDGLSEVETHRAADVYRTALARLDYPIVLAAARALQGTPDRSPAAAAVLQTLAELSARHRDTSRDIRLALLDRVRELADASQAAALVPYLADPDPEIAARASETLAAWTGRAHPAKTTRLQTLSLPTPDELARTPAGVRVTMADGRSFEIRFFRDEAPVAAWRIARLASQGYYNGLTWHRVVPNFIIQGGSPGADEFVGDGPFMRDELSRRSHVRGTVGLSTRGRDTGDAQIFVNLVDVPRLDHEYTVIGEVVSGLDVVDSLMEGDTIAKVDVGR